MSIESEETLSADLFDVSKLGPSAAAVIAAESGSLWWAEMLSRWVRGAITPDELFMIYFMALVSHVLSLGLNANHPSLVSWPRRVGAVVFVASLANLIHLDRGFESAVLRFFMSLGIAWFAAGIFGIVLRPVRALMRFCVIGPLTSTLAAAKRRRLERERRREESEREQRMAEEQIRRLEEREQRAAEEAAARRLAAEQYERERPIRELELRLKAEERQREAERKERAAAEQERRRVHRDEALFRCKSMFDRLWPQFPPGYDEEWLQDYFRQYLGSDLSNDTLDERAEALIQTLQQLAHGRSARTVTEVRAHYEKARQDLRDSSLHPSELEQFLAKLAAREAEAISEVLDDE